MEIFEELEEIYVEVKHGVKLHTVIIGSGEPLVLLHGFPEFWYGWKEVILGLKNKYKLIIPDTRGVNLSDKPKGVENYKLDILVEDVKILSEKLGLGKCNLAGHDWGGVIAFGVGEKYPNILKKLIILNAPHYKILGKQVSEDSSQRRASGYMGQFLKPEAEEILSKNNFDFLKVAVFGMSKKKRNYTDFDKEKYIEAWSQPGALTGGLNYYRASISQNFGDNIGDNWTGIINVPTLVIHGMKDQFVRSGVLEHLKDYIKDLKIVECPRASHWVINDDPETVCSSIDEFIKS